MAARVSLSVLLALAVATAHASGPVGIFGIIERVVFEPDEAAAERIQVWGAFAYSDGAGGTDTSPVARGYLYFTLPPASARSPEAPELARREWRDLKSVAGSGQAVGFGQWGYIGRFSELRLDGSSAGTAHVPERSPRPSLPTMRVRPATEPPLRPAEYYTNAGVVKLPESGSHAEIVRTLRNALRGR